MKTSTLCTTLALLAACAVTAAQAAPTTLDMNSLGWDLSVGQLTQGFELRSSGGFAFIGNSSNCSPRCADNGSNYVWSAAASLGVSDTTGATFDLASFDGAETHIGVPSIWAGAIQVVGRYADGGTVSTQFVLDRVNDGSGPLDDFQTFWLPSTFSALTAVSFSVAGGQYGQFALDNIALNRSFQSMSSTLRAGAIPEPASLLLSGMALLLAAAAWRLQHSRRPRPLPLA